MQTLSEIINQKIEARKKRMGIVEQPRTLTESELAWERAKRHLLTLPKDITGLMIQKAIDHEPFMYKESRFGTMNRYWTGLTGYEVVMPSRTYTFPVEAVVYENDRGEVKNAHYAVYNNDNYVAFVRDIWKKGMIVEGILKNNENAI